MAARGASTDRKSSYTTIICQEIGSHPLCSGQTLVCGRTRGNENVSLIKVVSLPRGFDTLGTLVAGGDRELAVSFLKQLCISINQELRQSTRFSCLVCGKPSTNIQMTPKVYGDDSKGDNYIFIYPCIPLCASNICKHEVERGLPYIHETKKLLAKSCEGCKKFESSEGSLKSCGRCKQSFYCSAECQVRF